MLPAPISPLESTYCRRLAVLRCGPPEGITRAGVLGASAGRRARGGQSRGRQPGDGVQPEPPSTSPADDNPRSAAGRKSSNMQMLSAGHIEETEMLQDSEQQTRAPSTSRQTPERAVTVDAQLSPPIFMGAGAEAKPAARQPRRCKSCVRACCRIVSSKRGRGGSCCAGRWSTPWRSTLGSWRSKHGQ